MSVDGFAPGAPVMTKVSWSASEVPLDNAAATPYGLLAEYAGARWFVPWSAITYMKQDLSTAGVTAAAKAPTVFTPTAPTVVPHE